MFFYFRHKKVCKTRWECPFCHRTLFSSGTRGNIELAKQTHICGQRLCQICKCAIDAERPHSCSHQFPTFPKIYNRLAFYDLETYISPTTGNHICNICSVVYESVKHGRFNKITFCDPKMNYSLSGIVQKSIFTKNYLPQGEDENIYTKKVANRFFKKENFQNKSPSYENKDECVDVSKEVSKNRDPIDAFLDFFLCEKFQNTTFLAHAGNIYNSS